MKIAWRNGYVIVTTKLGLYYLIYSIINKPNLIKANLLTDTKVSNWINVPINLTTTSKGHHISLSRQENQSGLLAKEEHNLKAGYRQKNWTFLVQKIRKVPLDLKSNYGMATVMYAENVTPFTKKAPPPPLP